MYHDVRISPRRSGDETAGDFPDLPRGWFHSRPLLLSLVHAIIPVACIPVFCAISYKSVLDSLWSSICSILCTKWRVACLQSFAGGEAENIGWIIPTPVINHFLKDFITNGAFTGFPSLGIKWQRMESACLRRGFCALCPVLLCPSGFAWIVDTCREARKSDPQMQMTTGVSHSGFEGISSGCSCEVTSTYVSFTCCGDVTQAVGYLQHNKEERVKVNYTPDLIGET